MNESPEMVDTDLPVRDVVGVGFGPANLALAIAIEEHNMNCAPGEQISAQFLEKQDRFAWHPGMLLDGATMQIAFPKDLVTFRNPRSAYTFFNYLFERGRLVDFVNHQTFFPTRHEFHDYLQWAAGRVSADVQYGTAVESVRGIRNSDGTIDRFEVRASDGTAVIARNVVMGAGLQERIPEWASQSMRCFHNHQFLFRIGELPAPVHQRFAVLGAGQSAAEIVQYLHSNFPEAEVHSVFSRYGYSPADDSPYANRIFDPEAVDDLHGAPEVERLRLLDVHRSTNYSVVDIELINELYAKEYQERVRGRRRLFMRRASEIVSVEESSDGIDVAVRSAVDGLTDTLACDALILATGFTPAHLEPLLGDLAPKMHPPREVGRDYRLAVSPDVTAGIYLQGGTEKTHGITSSLLSNVAVRAGEILTSVVTRRGRIGTLASVNAQDTYATSEAR
ncbi:lysine N(6)-hydroxylase/L-ornithine N(5)-oxygenase family protein [Rhodococcus tibetensis]|uniref:L-lysine N6-monooxygenase MbtG n=1 Tax=Rhodococcus tibetensis TaxID=2965064 RepID=A0ABT1Q9G1_9NOCA|nr:SidA/IucD/PvdA family monooxygenase [Rhodococcus sp. FXJ9.536]MCQ4117805.1 lysine N(6)-hydroxylase/L-ornithine N(5)-oxygenase family protein [Rhodococcus sp. FXJ9.536]